MPLAPHKTLVICGSQNPGNRHLSKRLSSSPGEFVKLADSFQNGLLQILITKQMRDCDVPRSGRDSVKIFIGQKALIERTKRDDPDPFVLRNRKSGGFRSSD